MIFDEPTIEQQQQQQATELDRQQELDLQLETPGSSEFDAEDLQASCDCGCGECESLLADVLCGLAFTIGMLEGRMERARAHLDRCWVV